jgi:hypothetical protein
MESKMTFGAGSVKEFYSAYQQSKPSQDAMIFGLSKS